MVNRSEILGTDVQIAEDMAHRIENVLVGQLQFRQVIATGMQRFASFKV